MQSFINPVLALRSSCSRSCRTCFLLVCRLSEGILLGFRAVMYSDMDQINSGINEIGPV